MGKKVEISHLWQTNGKLKIVQHSQFPLYPNFSDSQSAYNISSASLVSRLTKIYIATFVTEVSKMK